MAKKKVVVKKAKKTPAKAKTPRTRKASPAKASSPKAKPSAGASEKKTAAPKSRKKKAATTKKKTAPRSRPTKSPAPAPDPPPIAAVWDEDQLRKVKTGLTKRDLERFKKLLLTKRAEIIGDVTTMEWDIRHKHDDGNLSHVPMHMADMGSDNFEQEFTLGLVESESRLLREIDAALMRIEQKVYGVCLDRAVPIGKLRLEAKPWAKYCIEAARERERRNLQ